MAIQKSTAAALAMLALSACGGAGEKVAATDGPDGSRSFAARDFTGVELAGSDNVTVKQGQSFAVTATGPQAVLDKLDIRVANGVLVIRRKPENFSWSNSESAAISVTMPTLSSVEVSGSGKMNVDRATGAKVSATLSGSGDLEIATVETEALNVALAGSGDVKVKGGRATLGDYSLAGSGDIDTSGMTMANVSVSLAGSGDVRLTATAAAEISLVGSGDVTVGGGAKCDSSELGSGSVSCG